MLACELDSQPVPLNPDPLRHYIVARSDLPVGFLCAQIAHASGESSPGNLPEGTYAVVLAARDEQQLLETARRLALAGVPHVLIREPDAPWCGQATAIGLVPTRDPQARRLLSSLPLLRRAAT